MKMEREQTIRDYLLNCRELNRLCRQNGWIDNETLHFEIANSNTEEATVAVWFTEIIMEGAGRMADRLERFGKLRLQFDSKGAIRSASQI